MELYDQIHNALPVFDVLLHRVGARIRCLVVNVGDFVKLGVEFRHVRRAPRGDLDVFLLDADGSHLGNWLAVVEVEDARRRGFGDCDLLEEIGSLAG